MPRTCRDCLYPLAECACIDIAPDSGTVTTMSDQPVTADLDVSALADAVRESGIALRPGDVLAVRLPMQTHAGALRDFRDYARLVEQETGVKVAFIPGEEFQHTTVNITVNGFTGSEAHLAERISALLGERALAYQRRSNASPLDVRIP